LTIFSDNADFINDISVKIHDEPAFCYDSEPDICIEDGQLRVGFTCRWTCEDAWYFLDNLMADQSYQFRQVLIDSSIRGSLPIAACGAT